MGISCVALLAPCAPALSRLGPRWGPLRLVSTALASVGLGAFAVPLPTPSPSCTQLLLRIPPPRSGPALHSPVACSPSTVGVVGVLWVAPQGVQGGYSVSVNYRRAGSTPLLNFVLGAMSNWPVSFLVRHVLTGEDCHSFEQAVGTLGATDLMSPVYFTVAGMLPGQGAVIT
eukprot:gene1335-2737_t